MDCVWHEWDDPKYPRKLNEWTDCTRDCRLGTKNQTRTVLIPADHNGKPCNETGNATKQFPCNEKLCPEEAIQQTCTKSVVKIHDFANLEDV